MLAKTMTPKSVLVTGSNQGLGFHCAAALVAGGHRVILACRNVSAANEAADKIAAGDASKRQQITVLDEACDLADLASVRKYAGAVVASLAGSKLDVLVLNAGLGGTPVYTITVGWTTISLHVGTDSRLDCPGGRFRQDL